MSAESRAANRAGLARFRPLAARSNTNENTDISSNSKTNAPSNGNANLSNNNKITDLPDGWYFNETREQDFWDDIERGQIPQTEESEAKKLMLKKTEQITDLQDTSSKLRNLVDQFDEIDQDTLMILLQLYDDGYGAIDELDQQMIMNDSKTHVLDFMTQLKGLSDSQTSLMENLRFFFSTLQQHSNNGENDNISGEEIPDVDDAFEQLSTMLKEYAEKSERAACLHNDINDFWFKQIANYKRVVLMRDEEIRKLQKSIGDTHIAQARKNRKKGETDKDIDALKGDVSQKEQLEIQIQLNKQLKYQIEKLKACLKEGDIQRVSLESSLSNSSFDKDSLMKDNEINSMKIDFETKMSTRKATIEQLMKQIEQLKKIICDQGIKYDQLNDKYHEMEKERDELKASLQKQMKLLELEQQRNKEKPQPVQDNLIDRQELYEAEMMHQNEIRELKERHRNELIKALEDAREEYVIERQKLIDSIESGDTKSIIESISSECEKKIQQQKEEYEMKEKGLLKSWAGKVALLTRQYENRLKTMAASHEVDLLIAKDSVKYEIQKAELDLEERYSLQLLEMGRAREEKYDQFNRQLENLSNELTLTKEENATLRAQLQSLLKSKENVETAQPESGIKPIKPTKTTKVTKSTKSKKDSKTKETKESKEAKETKEASEVNKSNETTETNETTENNKTVKENNETDKTIESNQPNQPNQIIQSNQPNQPNQIIQSNQTNQPNQTIQSNQTNQINQTIETTKSRNALKGNDNSFLPSEKERLIEKYAMKMKIMKEEMDEQMTWALDKQKNYYEREMSKVMIQHQKEMRERLMELQEVIAHFNHENDKLTVDETEKEEDQEEKGQREKRMVTIMKEISETFYDMNSQFEKIDENEEEPTMTVKEAAARTKALTDRLIQLSSENQELKASTVFTESSDDIIQNLRDRLSYMESLQKGDSKEALEKMKQMEAQYKHELEVKDQMLLNFQRINEMFSKLSPNKLQIEIVSKELTSIMEENNLFHSEIESNVSAINLDQFNVQNCPESLAKPPPAETNSAPIEYTTLKRPAEINPSNTSRKKPMRMHTHQEIQAGDCQCLIDLAISEVNQFVEISEGEISPLQFKPTAFLIDEELHNLILNDVVPIHAENEKNLVAKVIDEVFDRLPLSKTTRDTSSTLSLEKYTISPKTENATKEEDQTIVSTVPQSVVAISVSPSQKKINQTNKHFSFVVIQSFYIPKAVVRERRPVKPKTQKVQKVKQETDSKQEKTVDNNTNTNNNNNENNNNNVVVNTNNDNNNDDDNNIVTIENENEDDDSVEYVCLSISDNCVFSFEKIRSKRLYIEESYPIFDYTFDDEAHLTIAEIKRVIPEPEPEPDPEPTYKALPSSTTTRLQQQEPARNTISISNIKVTSVDENIKLPVGMAIDNEVLIDVPYILHTNEELSEEVKSHILNLEKEISELKGRPLPTQIVNTYVAREPNPDQRQITLQLYMPLTGEESKKLRAERRRRLSKDPQQTMKTSADTLESITSEQSNLIIEESPTKEEEQENHSAKFDDSFLRSKSMSSIQSKKEEPQQIVHAESQMALTRDLSSFSFESDPFAAAKQIITSNIKYTQKFTSTETELLKKLGESMEVYDAYVSASGIADESYYSFLNDLKQSKKDLDTIHSQSFQMNLANDSLLKRINQMAVAYEKVLNKLTEIENEAEDQNIALQKEILDSIATTDNNDQPTSVSNLEKLHKLESSLDLLENLGLIKDPELLTQKQKLLEEIKSTQNKITSNEEVSQETIDKLITETQDFIGGIKPVKSRPSSPTEEDDGKHSKEQMKKDLSRIRRQRDSLKRHLNLEQQKTEELKQQIIALNDKINTERENYDSDLLAYKAQIDTLKKSISSEGQSAIDLLKQQLISMQALAESSRNERDLFKGKLDDAEEALLMKEETIDNLNQQLETLLQNDFEKSQETKKKTKSSKKKSEADMFKVEEYDMSKEVKKANDELKLQQSKQMETLMAENKKLNDEINNLNQKIIHLKQKLRTAKDANADMNLKLALGVPPKEGKTSDKATQFPPASFINLSDSKSSISGNKSNFSAVRSREKIKQTESQELRLKKEKEEKEKELLNNQNAQQQENANKEEENQENNNENENNDENNKGEQIEQSDEMAEDEEQKTPNEEQNEIENQDSNLSFGEGFDTFDSYEELDTVGDVLLKMPDDKSDDVKYKFGDFAPRVHDPIYLPKKKKKNKIMILNTLPKTQRGAKKVQPSVIHHLPGGPSIENKNKEREEDLKALTINNQPQGKRYLTGTTQPVRPTSSVLKSNGARNNNLIFDQDGNQIDVGNEEKIPIIESAFTLPSYSEDSSGTNNNHSTSIGSYGNNMVMKNNEAATNKTSYIVDRSLQSNPIAPLRITLVVHDKDKEKEKEQRKSYSNPKSILNNNNNGPIVIPIQTDNQLKRLVTPLDNYSKGQPPVVGKPIDKGPGISEAQKIINKLREKNRRLQASNDQKDIEIVTLKQKISELTLTIHRLKLDTIKKADDYKRLSIRYDYILNKLEMRSTDVVNRDEEIQKLKRELVIVRMQVQPVNQQLAKLKNAQRERDRLQKEQERRKAVALATKNALSGSKPTNESTKKHLERILENQRLSIARIEAQRRMWLDIEKNHMMGVLSAMSLLSTSQYKIVKGVLPSYSPFSSSKVTTLKQVLDMNNKRDNYNYKSYQSNFANRHQIESANLLSSLNPDYSKNNAKGMTITYADKLYALDRIEPPLSKEEKEMIIQQKESPEIEQRIMSLLQNERSQNTMSKVKIDTNYLGSNS